ncbi:hypothetical protein IWX65_003017 [Arthrobacter sp. CAN_A214]
MLHRMNEIHLQWFIHLWAGGAPGIQLKAVHLWVNYFPQASQMMRKK